MATDVWTNFDSDNDLLPDGIKPLGEAMLAYDEYNPLSFAWG